MAIPSGELKEAVYERAPARAWHTLGILTFMYAIAFIDRQMLAFMVDPVRADLGISDFQLSLLHGFGFALFYTLFGLPVGYLVDRVSRRRIIYVGMSIWSVACAACGLARDFSQFLFARLMVGAGEAALNPAAYSMISDAFHKRGVTLALSIYATGATLGGAIAMALVAYLISYFTGLGTVSVPLIGELAPWRVVFLIVGLPGLFFALLNFTMPEPQRLGRMSDQAPPFSAIWTFIKQRKRYFICHFVGYGLVQATGFSFFSWMPTFMIRHHGWEVAKVGTVAGLATASSIPLAMLIGWCVERLYRAGYTDIHFTWYVVMLPISATLLIIGVMLPNPNVAVAIFAICIGLNSYVGIASAGLQLVTPNEFRGQVSVVFLLVMTVIGAGIGPSVPAAFTDFVFHDDSKVGLSIALTMAIFAPMGAAFLWFGRSAARRAIEEAQAWG